MDYFVFRKGTLGKIPHFLVGRDSWDNWMVYNALKKGLKVVDATKSITALHQNHSYSHLNHIKKSSEDMANDLIAKGKIATINDSDYKINKNAVLSRRLGIEKSFGKILNTVEFNLYYLYLGLVKLVQSRK